MAISFTSTFTLRGISAADFNDAVKLAIRTAIADAMDGVELADVAITSFVAARRRRRTAQSPQRRLSGGGVLVTFSVTTTGAKVMNAASGAVGRSAAAIDVIAHIAQQLRAAQWDAALRASGQAALAAVEASDVRIDAPGSISPSASPSASPPTLAPSASPSNARDVAVVATMTTVPTPFSGRTVAAEASPILMIGAIVGLGFGTIGIACCCKAKAKVKKVTVAERLRAEQRETKWRSLEVDYGRKSSKFERKIGRLEEDLAAAIKAMNSATEATADAEQRYTLMKKKASKHKLKRKESKKKMRGSRKKKKKHEESFSDLDSMLSGITEVTEVDEEESTGASLAVAVAASKFKSNKRKQRAREKAKASRSRQKLRRKESKHKMKGASHRHKGSHKDKKKKGKMKRRGTKQNLLEGAAASPSRGRRSRRSSLGDRLEMFKARMAVKEASDRVSKLTARSTKPKPGGGTETRERVKKKFHGAMSKMSVLRALGSSRRMSSASGPPSILSTTSRPSFGGDAATRAADSFQRRAQVTAPPSFATMRGPASTRDAIRERQQEKSRQHHARERARQDSIASGNASMKRQETKVIL